MKAADIFVLPSLAEGFSLVVAEAMCLGKPILATDCAGPKELLDNGTCGMLVGNNEEAIYRGLKMMITDKALREDYVRKALSRSKMFDADKTMELIYGLLPGLNTDTEMDLNERILNHIILSSAASNNPGLIDGKMGVILFLMEYARSSDRDLYKEMAEDMLDGVWEEVSVEAPVGLASGLCGIGWGIEYLIQNGFVEGDADEICEDMDNAVCLQKIHPDMNRSLDSSLVPRSRFRKTSIFDARLTDRSPQVSRRLARDSGGR